jgi:hypothetical protein
LPLPARGVEARHQVAGDDGPGRARTNDISETTAREADRGQHAFDNIAGAFSRGTASGGTTEAA